MMKIQIYYILFALCCISPAFCRLLSHAQSQNASCSIKVTDVANSSIPNAQIFCNGYFARKVTVEISEELKAYSIVEDNTDSGRLSGPSRVQVNYVPPAKAKALYHIEYDFHLHIEHIYIQNIDTTSATVLSEESVATSILSIKASRVQIDRMVTTSNYLHDISAIRVKGDNVSVAFAQAIFVASYSSCYPVFDFTATQAVSIDRASLDAVKNSKGNVLHIMSPQTSIERVSCARIGAVRGACLTIRSTSAFSQTRIADVDATIIDSSATEYGGAIFIDGIQDVSIESLACTKATSNSAACLTAVAPINALKTTFSLSKSTISDTCLHRLAQPDSPVQVHGFDRVQFSEITCVNNGVGCAQPLQTSTVPAHGGCIAVFSAQGGESETSKRLQNQYDLSVAVQNSVFTNNIALKGSAIWVDAGHNVTMRNVSVTQDAALSPGVDMQAMVYMDNRGELSNDNVMAMVVDSQFVSEAGQCAFMCVDCDLLLFNNDMQTAHDTQLAEVYAVNRKTFLVMSSNRLTWSYPLRFPSADMSQMLGVTDLVIYQMWDTTCYQQVSKLAPQEYACRDIAGTVIFAQPEPQNGYERADRYPLPLYLDSTSTQPDFCTAPVTATRITFQPNEQPQEGRRVRSYIQFLIGTLLCLAVGACTTCCLVCLDWTYVRRWRRRHARARTASVPGYAWADVVDLNKLPVYVYSPKNDEGEEDCVSAVNSSGESMQSKVVGEQHTPEAARGSGEGVREDVEGSVGQGCSKGNTQNDVQPAGDRSGQALESRQSNKNGQDYVAHAADGRASEQGSCQINSAGERGLVWAEVRTSLASPQATSARDQQATGASIGMCTLQRDAQHTPPAPVHTHTDTTTYSPVPPHAQSTQLDDVSTQQQSRAPTTTAVLTILGAIWNAVTRVDSTTPQTAPRAQQAQADSRAVRTQESPTPVTRALVVLRDVLAFALHNLSHADGQYSAPTHHEKATRTPLNIPPPTIIGHVHTLPSTDCVICLDQLAAGQQVTVLPCQHWFHYSCIAGWLHGKDYASAECPTCRELAFDLDSMGPPPQSAGAGGQEQEPGAGV